MLDEQRRILMVRIVAVVARLTPQEAVRQAPSRRRKQTCDQRRILRSLIQPIPAPLSEQCDIRVLARPPCGEGISSNRSSGTKSTCVSASRATPTRRATNVSLDPSGPVRSNCSYLRS